MNIVGIDPGTKGSIAVIAENGIAMALKLPANEELLWRILVRLDPVLCLVEQVNAGPDMGSSSAFKFGRGYGSICMACQAAFGSDRWRLVLPAMWQDEFGLIFRGAKRRLGEGDTEKANATKAKAVELFPHLKIHHWNAAGLLIAEYARRVMELENG